MNSRELEIFGEVQNAIFGLSEDLDIPYESIADDDGMDDRLARSMFNVIEAFIECEARGYPVNIIGQTRPKS